MYGLDGLDGWIYLRTLLLLEHLAVLKNYYYYYYKLQKTALSPGHWG